MFLVLQDSLIAFQLRQAIWLSAATALAAFGLTWSAIYLTTDSFDATIGKYHPANVNGLSGG